MRFLEQSLAANTFFNSWQVLKAHSNEEIFYRTDHHWKILAAFYVYQAEAKNRGYSSLELEDYEVQTVSLEFQGTIQLRLGIHTRNDTLEIFYPVNSLPFTVQGRNSLYDYSALRTKDKYVVFFAH